MRVNTREPSSGRAASVDSGAAFAVPAEGVLAERVRVEGVSAETSDLPARAPHRPDIDPVVPEVSRRPIPTHGRTHRAGRNLTAAITVGVVMVLVAISAVVVMPLLFAPLVALAAVIGALEVANALERANLRVPAIPLLVASVGIVVSASVYGADGLLVSTAIGILVLIVWRVVEATGLMAMRDTVASIFTLIWVPFMASFAVLLMAQDGGPYKVLLALGVPVANDVGGFMFGVLFGAHPMAPSISPKKSWEGFAGSLLFGVVLASLVCFFLIPGIPWFVGALIGVLMVVVATIGDLCESLLKRDLGVKDMGQLLPGHGGLMDRLDSMLLTAPTLFIVLSIWEAIGG